MTLRLLGKRLAIIPPQGTTTPSGIYVGPEHQPLKGEVFLAAQDAMRQGINPGMTVHFGRRSGQRVPMTSAHCCGGRGPWTSAAISHCHTVHYSM